jgi:hypothetical protein
MRSAPSSTHRRLHPRPGPPSPLQAIARLVDELAADEPGHLLVHVLAEPGPELALGTKPFDRSVHPFDLLAGFTAPADWAVLGVRAQGTAHHLDEPHHAPQRTTTTMLLDRSGAQASVLRVGDDVTDVPGVAVGTIPDLCRRALGLPTDPPPAPTTRLLWITIWLDRIMAAWSDPARRRLLTGGWAQLAILHPAVAASPDDDLLTVADPARLVALAQAHTEAWPWHRLRAEPDAAPLPEGHLTPELASWMDDGFYARWALGAFPHAVELATDLRALLDEPQRSQLVRTIIELLGP